MADVLFREGDPDSIEAPVDGLKVFFFNKPDTFLIIKNELVTGVYQLCSNFSSVQLNGISCRANSAAVFEHLGKPNKVEMHDDKDYRTYYYPEYQTAYLMKNDKVDGIGVYDRKSKVRLVEYVVKPWWEKYDKVPWEKYEKAPLSE
jgi:hypothetical protein